MRDRHREAVEKRPASVSRRERLGDYEADLIIGYRQSGNVVVVNDRKSRVDEIAALLDNCPRKCLGYLTPNEVHFKTKSLHTLIKHCTSS